MDSNFNNIIAMKKLAQSIQAKELLCRMAVLVKPIMIKRNWRVDNLVEFYPKRRNLLGLNVNKTRCIKIRLRNPDNISQFMVFEDLLGTLLHELCHINYSAHDELFYGYLKILKKEAAKLLLSNAASISRSVGHGSLDTGSGSSGSSGNGGNGSWNRITGGSINFKPGTKLLIKTFNSAKNNSASQPAGSGRNSSIPTFSKRGRRLMDSPEYKGPSNSGVNNNTNTKHETKEDTQRKRGRKMDLVALAAQQRYLKAKSLLSNRRGDISIGGIDVPKRTGGYSRESTAVKSDEGIKMSTKNAIVVIDDENENTGGSGSRSASSTVDFTRKQKGSTYFDPIEIT